MNFKKQVFGLLLLTGMIGLLGQQSFCAPEEWCYDDPRCGPNR